MGNRLPTHIARLAATPTLRAEIAPELSDTDDVFDLVANGSSMSANPSLTSSILGSVVLGYLAVRVLAGREGGEISTNERLHALRGGKLEVVAD